MAEQRVTPTQALLRFFEHEHLPAHLAGVSELCGDLARELEELLPDGPEKTSAMRKLLEAKDGFVRALL